MTPRDAMSHALQESGLTLRHQPDAEYPRTVADRVLAALPEGWALREGECVEGTLEVTDDEAAARADAYRLVEALLPMAEVFHGAHDPCECPTFRECHVNVCGHNARSLAAHDEATP
jgi:hypothetical protein